MIDPAYALQVAIAAALLADSTVTSLVGTNVFDPLSAVNSSYPFIEVGDDQVLEDTTQFIDGSEIFSTIHIWANGPGGRLAAKQIASAVRNVLQQPLSMTGHCMSSAIFHSARHMIDHDMSDQGQIAHSVLVFQYRTAPTS